MTRTFPLLIEKELESAQNDPYILLYTFFPLTIFHHYHPYHLIRGFDQRKIGQAMNVEMEVLEKNKSWELVKLLVGKKLVGYKWVSEIHNRWVNREI